MCAQWLVNVSLSNSLMLCPFCCFELGDTKGAIRNRKSKKERQHNGQAKKDKRTNNDVQNIHIKLKIAQHELDSSYDFDFFLLSA
jgi:hypothetical protein